MQLLLVPVVLLLSAALFVYALPLFLYIAPLFIIGIIFSLISDSAHHKTTPVGH
jgi:hypothetical protein